MRDWCPPALEEEVRLREHDDADPGRRDELRDLLLARLGLHAEADAVARRDAVGEAAVEHAPREVLEREHLRVEALVGVQVDRKPASAAIARKLSFAACGSDSRCGQPADEVDAHADRLAQTGARLGSLGADARATR
jgi:hypothetical protein